MKKIFGLILFLLFCVNLLTAQHLKKDGTPDRRYTSKNPGYWANKSDSISNCPIISFNRWFVSPHKIESYYDFDEGLKCSRISNKPYLVYFTGHGSVNSREMEALIWPDKEIIKLLKNQFVIATLCVDDNDLTLPKDKQIILEYGRDTIKLYSKKQTYIEKTKFKNDKIPAYFIINSEEKVLAGPYYYNMNKMKFKKFLEKGIEAYLKQ